MIVYIIFHIPKFDLENFRHLIYPVTAPHSVQHLALNRDTINHVYLSARDGLEQGGYGATAAAWTNMIVPSLARAVCLETTAALKMLNDRIM